MNIHCIDKLEKKKKTYISIKRIRFQQFTLPWFLKMLVWNVFSFSFLYIYIYVYFYNCDLFNYIFNVHWIMHLLIINSHSLGRMFSFQYKIPNKKKERNLGDTIEYLDYLWKKNTFSVSFLFFFFFSFFYAWFSFFLYWEY